MTRLTCAAVAAASLALAGCNKEGTSTAPPKPSQTATHSSNAHGTATHAANDQGAKNRKLSVTSPGNQNVTQDATTDFKVAIDRDNFDGPVTVALDSLPSGVSVVTKEMTIPAGQESVNVTLKAEPNAAAAVGHVVKVTAKSPEMPEAVTDFKLDVKAKK